MSVRPNLALLTLVSALGAALVGCGDDDGGGTGGGQGGGSTSGTGATTGTGDGGAAASTTGTGSSVGSGGGAECDYPEPNPSPAAPQAITLVEGTVLDSDGEPVEDVEVLVCGKDICLEPAATDADGNVSVTYDGTEIDTPLFKSGNGLDLAKIAFPIPVGASATVASVLPRMADSGTALATGVEAEADGVTLTVDAAGVVALNALDFSDPGEDTFRAGVVPQEQVDAVAPGEAFDMVVGLGPQETRFCPPATLTVPNDAGLPAGTAVEVFLHGIDVGEYFSDYGSWTKIAEGVVTEDGASIVTNEGEGLPVLSTVGIRAVP